MIKANIGKNISSLRKDRNMSQAELAKAVGVGRSTISSWETDRTEPSMQDVEKIAQVLDCKKEDIVRDYMRELIRDAEVQRILMYAQMLTEEQQRSMIQQMQYLIWKNKEEKKNGSV